MAPVLRPLAAVLALLVTSNVPVSALALILGPFTFDDSQFGDSLLESDGGYFRDRNWLNTVNANPGTPAALTGPNVETGIANIGFGGPGPEYSISYNTPIVNRAGGADLAIISARFSTNDTFRLEVSTDGIVFFPAIDFGPAAAIPTGQDVTYWCCPIDSPIQATASLFVTPIDLTSFGLADGASIQAVRITGSPEADLIRVAGLISVPESSVLLLVSVGLAILAAASASRRASRSSTCVTAGTAKD